VDNLKNLYDSIKSNKDVFDILVNKLKTKVEKKISAYRNHLKIFADNFNLLVNGINQSHFMI
jgi:hypothetical protein